MARTRIQGMLFKSGIKSTLWEPMEGSKSYTVGRRERCHWEGELEVMI